MLRLRLPQQVLGHPAIAECIPWASALQLILVRGTGPLARRECTSTCLGHCGYWGGGGGGLFACCLVLNV